MNKTSPLIDLGHEIFDGLIRYKGLPAPIICNYLSRSDSKKLYGEDDLSALALEKLANLP